MAMTTCRECGAQISDKAKTCPSCGAKVKRPAGKLATILVVGLGVAFVYSTIQTNRIQQEAADAEAARIASLSPEQKKAEEDARERALLIRASQRACRESLPKYLHDPDSAKYEPYENWPATQSQDGKVLVSPQGSAKNGFNAYRKLDLICAVSKDAQGKFAVSISSP